MKPFPRKARQLFSSALRWFCFLLVALTPLARGDQDPGGWSVVRIRIPGGSDIQEGHVELQTPGGRAVTLAPGDVTKEGARLEKLEWSGSPIRALITLRDGGQVRQLSAPATAVENDDSLQPRRAKVDVEVRYFEVAKEALPAVAVISDGEPLQLPSLFRTAQPEGAEVGVLSGKQSESLFQSLAARADVSLEGKGTAAARQESHETIDLPIPLPPPNGLASRERAIRVLVSAVDVVGDTVDLSFAPQLVEYQETAADTAIKGPRELVFSTRAISTSISVGLGQSIIWSGFSAEGAQALALPVRAGYSAFLIITPSRHVPEDAPR